MKKSVVLLALLLLFIICVETRKSSKSSSGSGRGSRGSGRKTNPNPQPAPTSFSNPQASAPKPTLFGWQEKSAPRKTQTYPSKQTNSHSYPSSQTGLSGNTPVKQPPAYQESIQRSGVPSQTAQRPGVQANNQPSHSYPSSNGLSGSAGSAGYPQGTGLSGSGPVRSSGAGYPQSNAASGTGVGYPQGSGVGYPQGSGVAGAGGPPPPYPGNRPGAYNGAANPSYGTGNHYPPQGPPPPYSNHGGYSGYGGHNMYNPGYGQQMPGYFGNYGNYGKGFGGVSRGSSALTGIGIAGAGVGTILTGLALWNMARSTGRTHHTVIYDNRGQPVAVAPDNGTDTEANSILKDLVNCTLTISGENSTEVLAIPCAIATSFTPEADVKVDESSNKSDNTKCTVTVVTTAGREFMTTIPCSILLKSAADNNVTEPPIQENVESINTSTISSPSDGQPTALKLSSDGVTPTVESDCSSLHETGEIRDPLNPCLAVTHNLTVIPLDPTPPSNLLTSTQ